MIYTFIIIIIIVVIPLILTALPDYFKIKKLKKLNKHTLYLTNPKYDNNITPANIGHIYYLNSTKMSDIIDEYIMLPKMNTKLIYKNDFVGNIGIFEDINKTLFRIHLLDVITEEKYKFKIRKMKFKKIVNGKNKKIFK